MEKNLWCGGNCGEIFFFAILELERWKKNCSEEIFFAEKLSVKNFSLSWISPSR